MATNGGPSCSNCENAWDLYTLGQGEVAGSNVERHSLLLRCPVCERHYDAYPEERAMPEPLDRDTAAKLYPEAF
jgi:hypothetical protein